MYQIIARKNPTVSSDKSLKIETSKTTHLKTYPKLQTKDKESTPSSVDVTLSKVSTEVDYSTQIGHKPTRKELYNMGNSETICLLKYSDIKMMLLANEGM